MSDPSTTATVGEIVATDFRTEGIFEQFGIDFCCGGRQSLADACRAATVDPDVVIRALDTLPPPAGGDEDVAAWPVVRLIEHIVSTHHAYVRSAMPLIADYLARLEAEHGPRHPELSRVRVRFAEISRELSQHM